MNKLIVNEFKGKQLITIIWNNKPCWISRNVAVLLNPLHEGDVGATVNSFFRNNKSLENGIDYELLKGVELINFKNFIAEYQSEVLEIKKLNLCQKLNIFYSKGLIKYIKSFDTLLSQELFEWINQEVFTLLKKYIGDDTLEILYNKEIKNNIKMITSIKVALNKFINELGLSNILKVVVIKDEEEFIVSDKHVVRRRRGYGKSKIESSDYIDDIQKMLLDGVKYEDISGFLKSKGENISKSSVGRYAIKFSKTVESNNPPKKGGDL